MCWSVYNFYLIKFIATAQEIGYQLFVLKLNRMSFLSLLLLSATQNTYN